jgi:hypothetical protein
MGIPMWMAFENHEPPRRNTLPLKQAANPLNQKTGIG